MNRFFLPLVAAGMALTGCGTDATTTAQNAALTPAPARAGHTFSITLPADLTSTSAERRIYARASPAATLALIERTEGLTDWRAAQRIADDIVAQPSGHPLEGRARRIAAAAFMLDRYLLAMPAADAHKAALAGHTRTLLTDGVAELHLLAPALKALDGYLPEPEMRAALETALTTEQPVRLTAAAKARGATSPSDPLRAELQTMVAEM